MDLSAVLRDFLGSHDRLVLPRLGSFSAGYRSARIDFAAKRIYPPHKSFAFDSKSEATEDGAFLAFLARQRGLDVLSAQTLLDDYIELLETSLLQTGTAELVGIGRLHYEPLQGIVFTADSTNFLSESFGLEPIECLPVRRVKEQAANPELLSLLPVAASSSRRRRLPLSLIIGFAGMALLTFFAAWWRYGRTTETQPAPPISLNDANGDSAKTNPSENLNPQPEPQPDTVALANPIPEPEPVVQSSSSEQALVILGVFEEAGNAERLLSKLRADGYAPETETLYSGARRIGVRLPGANEAERKDALKNLRRKYSTKAWILEE